MNIREIYNKLFPPYGMKILSKAFWRKFSKVADGNCVKKCKFLDIGAGNHSAQKFRKIFGPSWSYTALDINKADYNYDERDLNEINNFITGNIEDTNLLELFPNEKFDIIHFAHVIEHVNNGYDILSNIRRIQYDGSFLYIETPSFQSLSLPSRPLTLNFYDDPTHKVVYPLDQIIKTIEETGYIILKSGYRKDIRRILAFPFIALFFVLRGKRVPGPVVWEINNFSIFVLAYAV